LAKNLRFWQKGTCGIVGFEHRPPGAQATMVSVDTIHLPQVAPSLKPKWYAHWENLTMSEQHESAAGASVGRFHYHKGERAARRLYQGQELAEPERQPGEVWEEEGSLPNVVWVYVVIKVPERRQPDEYISNHIEECERAADAWLRTKYPEVEVIIPDVL
jgi:hypothetical protein